MILKTYGSIGLLQRIGKTLAIKRGYVISKCYGLGHRKQIKELLKGGLK